MPRYSGHLAVRETAKLCAATCVFFVVSSFAAQVTTTAVPIRVSAGGGGSTISGWPLLLAVDVSGNIYVAGNAQGNLAGTPGAFQSQPPGKDSRCLVCITPFVAKLDPTGTRMIYLTYLSGNLDDYISSVAVDAQGSVYAAGWTDSTNFPTTANSLRNFSPHAWPAFVVKLNPSGTNIEYGVLLGGSGFEGQPVAAVAVDPAGNAFIIGSTDSTDFPITAGAFQKTPGTPAVYGESGFISKLNASGSALVYSSYIAAFPRAIAVAKNGQAYVTGQSWGRLTTTPGVVQPRNNGASDAIVLKIGADGTLLYATYVGGPARDTGVGIAVDDQGSAYVTGDTRMDESSPTQTLTQPLFPVTAGAFQTFFDGEFQSGSSDAFLFKLSPDGSSLIYSTYLGGGGDDSGHMVQVTAQGEAVVMGGTYSPNFPTTHDAYISTADSIFTDLTFLALLDDSGRKLKYSTFLPGDGQLAVNAQTGTAYAIVSRDGSPEIARVNLAAEPPPLFLGGIGNAASYQGGTVAPGELVTLFGTGIGPTQAVRDGGFLGVVGTMTGGVQVFFDEIAAPVLYAASDELHVQVPFEITGRATIQAKVRYAGGESNSIQLQVADAVAGVYTVTGRGSGQAAILNQDGTVNSAVNPASPGSTISVFVTGGGVTNPPSGTGRITPPSSRPLLVAPIQTSWPVTFAGAAPGLESGVVQINVQIPADAPAGDAVPFGLSIGGSVQDMQNGLTLAIR